MPRYAALQRAHRAALVLLVVAPAVLCAQTRRLGFATDRLARIDRVMQQYVDSGQIGGAVGLVLQDGRVVYQHAVGWLDKESGRRMTPDALFRIASQTKAVTTVAILSLVEEGKLAIGDPVAATSRRSRTPPSRPRATPASSLTPRRDRSRSAICSRTRPASRTAPTD